MSPLSESEPLTTFSRIPRLADRLDAAEGPSVPAPSPVVGRFLAAAFLVEGFLLRVFLLAVLGLGGDVGVGSADRVEDSDTGAASVVDR